MPKLKMNGQLSSWGTVLGTLVVLLTGSYYWGGVVEAMNTRMEEGEEKNKAQDELIIAIAAQQKQQTDQYAQLAPMIINIYRRGLIVQGKAFVLNVGDSPYVELNNWDPNGPTRLQGFNLLHITNLTNSDLVNEDIQLGPQFSNATPRYVMNLSKAAGELLHAQSGAWIEIKAVPVFEEDESNE